uniref:Uncharacterized protein n=1 Tax=Ananas comosus var. bracteatus TaxID=296719 RepID=A0A6V7P006_ANACO|nr:unnamed protein product [Ananas comosus var. bracteatus]
MGRAPCCDKRNVKRGPWSPEEDAILRSYVEMYGTGGNWIALPQKAGLKRCGKSCRLRWLNYLRPNIKHGGFTEEEDTIICSLYNSIGSRWSIIASKLPGRTDNDIKNYWNTKLKKKFTAGLITTTSTSSSSRIYHSLPTSPPPPLPLPDHLPTIKAESFAMPRRTCSPKSMHSLLICRRRPKRPPLLRPRSQSTTTTTTATTTTTTTATTTTTTTTTIAVAIIGLSMETEATTPSSSPSSASAVPWPVTLTAFRAYPARGVRIRR